MRDVRLVLACEDVPRTLRAARELGLIILDDSPTPSPAPKFVEENDIDAYQSGSFIMYRPEWVFDAFAFSVINRGHFKGSFFRHPNTNNTSIQFHCSRERVDGVVKRLGSGGLSRNIEWYRSVDHTVHPAPPSVATALEDLRKRISTGKYLRGGGRRYFLLQGALKKLTNGDAVPPFDYIEFDQIQG